MVSIIYLSYTRVDLRFAAHKLKRFSSNPGKVYFEGLVNVLKCIRVSKNLVLKYYSRIEDAHLSNLFRWGRIKSDNQLMVFSDFSRKDCPDTGRSIGSYIVFCQCVPIDHCTHVPGTVAQYSAESDYNAAFTSVIALAHFRILNNDLRNKDTYVVPE